MCSFVTLFLLNSLKQVVFKKKNLGEKCKKGQIFFRKQDVAILFRRLRTLIQELTKFSFPNEKKRSQGMFLMHWLTSKGHNNRKNRAQAEMSTWIRNSVINARIKQNVRRKKSEDRNVALNYFYGLHWQLS
jgi:hypothetical protein